MLISKTKTYRKKLFLILASLWIFSICFSYFCAFGLDEGKLFDLKEYIESVKGANKSYYSLFKNGIFSNLKITLFMLILAREKFTSPFLVVPFLYKAFSIGFTSSVFIRIYFLKGLWFCLYELFFALFYTPIYFFMVIKGFEFAFKKSEAPFVGQSKNKNHLSLLGTYTIYFLCLCAICFLESVLFKLIIC